MSFFILGFAHRPSASLRKHLSFESERRRRTDGAFVGFRLLAFGARLVDAVGDADACTRSQSHPSGTCEDSRCVLRPEGSNSLLKKLEKVDKSVKGLHVHAGRQHHGLERA